MTHRPEGLETLVLDRADRETKLPRESLEAAPPLPHSKLTLGRPLRVDLTMECASSERNVQKAKMLSLQSFLRKGRVVGLCWAN